MTYYKEKFVILNNDVIKEQVHTLVSELLTNVLDSTGAEGVSIINAMGFMSQIDIGRYLYSIREDLNHKIHEAVIGKFTVPNTTCGTISGPCLNNVHGILREGMVNHIAKYHM